MKIATSREDATSALAAFDVGLLSWSNENSVMLDFVEGEENWRI